MIIIYAELVGKMEKKGVEREKRKERKERREKRKKKGKELLEDEKGREMESAWDSEKNKHLNLRVKMK